METVRLEGGIGREFFLLRLWKLNSENDGIDFDHHIFFAILRLIRWQTRR